MATMGTAPTELVVVGDTLLASLYVLDLAEEPGPVCIVDPGTAMTARERIAADFGAFLDRVQQIIR